MVQTHEQLKAVDYYIGANVEVAPDAVIAAGVVLEAAPGARLVVAAGVCIGSGVIVQAAGGKLTLGTGVNLGTGVLIVGQGVVGPHACVGSESSLLNPQVSAGAVIPARSLLGVQNYPPSLHNGQSAETHANQRVSSSTDSSSTDTDVATENGDNGVGAEDAAAIADKQSPNSVVYGREQVVQLMKTLFPHRDALNNNGNGSSNGNGSP